jgi:hypothetical protein
MHEDTNFRRLSIKISSAMDGEPMEDVVMACCELIVAAILTATDRDRDACMDFLLCMSKDMAHNLFNATSAPRQQSEPLH